MESSVFFKEFSKEIFKLVVVLWGRQGQVSIFILKLKKTCREMKGGGRLIYLLSDSICKWYLTDYSSLIKCFIKKMNPTWFPERGIPKESELTSFFFPRVHSNTALFFCPSVKNIHLPGLNYDLGEYPAVRMLFCLFSIRYFLVLKCSLLIIYFVLFCFVF